MNKLGLILFLVSLNIPTGFACEGISEDLKYINQEILELKIRQEELNQEYLICVKEDPSFEEVEIEESKEE